jgi:hypothetical protein
MRPIHVKRPKSNARLQPDLKNRILTRIKRTRVNPGRGVRVQSPPDCRPEIW